MVLVALHESGKAGRVAVMVSGEETVDVSADPVLSEISECADLLKVAAKHVREKRDRMIREAYGNGYGVKALATAAGVSQPRVWQILYDYHDDDPNGLPGPTREETDDRRSGSPTVP